MKNVFLGIIIGLIIGVFGTWAVLSWIQSMQVVLSEDKDLLNTQAQLSQLAGQMKQLDDMEASTRAQAAQTHATLQTTTVASPPSNSTVNPSPTSTPPANLTPASDTPAVSSSPDSPDANKALESLITQATKPSDNKEDQATMLATYELNQIAPTLQLGDDQKSQVLSILHDIDVNSQNPDWIRQNITTNTPDPIVIMEAITKAKENALSKILTPQQAQLYQKLAQDQLTQEKSVLQEFTPK